MILALLVLATAGGAAAVGDGAALGTCDDADPLCALPKDCEATDAGRLLGDPIGVILGCVDGQARLLA